VQEPEVLFGILMGVSLIPAGLAMLSMITLYFYRLDQKMLEDTVAEAVESATFTAGDADQAAARPLA
jgi:Na+/melibiose symporter-like transporter